MDDIWWEFIRNWIMGEGRANKNCSSSMSRSVWMVSPVCFVSVDVERILSSKVSFS